MKTVVGTPIINCNNTLVSLLILLLFEFFVTLFKQKCLSTIDGCGMVINKNL